MTQQEAEVLVARLTRIWQPDEGTVRCVIKVGRHLIYNCRLKGSRFRLFIGATYSNVFLYEQSESTCGFRVRFRPNETEYHFFTEADKIFAAQWMPLFRRNCWLSGLPIEASAHEKAEWLQGFTHQELQAWNLTF